jgi:hypothetical protein
MLQRKAETAALKSQTKKGTVNNLCKKLGSLEGHKEEVPKTRNELERILQNLS